MIKLPHLGLHSACDQSHPVCPLAFPLSITLTLTMWPISMSPSLPSFPKIKPLHNNHLINLPHLPKVTIHINNCFKSRNNVWPLLWLMHSCRASAFGSASCSSALWTGIFLMVEYGYTMLPSPLQPDQVYSMCEGGNIISIHQPKRRIPCVL